MKLGIVGTGMIVRDLMQMLHQVPVQSLAIYGRDLAKTQQLADECGIPLVFNDYAAMLHADVDTVISLCPIIFILLLPSSLWQQASMSSWKSR